MSLHTLGCAGRESGPLLYSNSVICISEIHSEFSDSIQFMQIHTEFRYDPPQGRRVREARQEWVELEAWPFVALVETRTTAPSRFEGAVVPGSTSCARLQPSYTVPNLVHLEA